MKTGVWTSYFGEFSPEDMIVKFAEKGWFSSELSSEHAGILLNRGNPDASGAAFRNFARDHGVELPQGHLWLSVDFLSSDQEKVMDRLKKWLDLFLAIGIRAAVLHPGGQEMIGRGCSHDEIREARIIALSSLTEYLKGTDMALCLENLIITAQEIEELYDLIDEVGSPNLAICLDTGHLNLNSGKQAAFIRKAGPRLKALHVADNEGKYDQHLMPFGRGTVPWHEVIIALREIKYEGLFNYEIPGETRCPLPVKLDKLDYIRDITKYITQNMLEDK